MGYEDCALLASLGENIRRLRQKKGLTQEAIAELAQLSPAHVCRIETGKKRAGLESALKLAEALNVTLDVLLGDIQSTGDPAGCPRLHHLCSDCTPRERQILCDIMEAAKESIRKHPS